MFMAYFFLSLSLFMSNYKPSRSTTRTLSLFPVGYRAMCGLVSRAIKLQQQVKVEEVDKEKYQILKQYVWNNVEEEEEETNKQKVVPMRIELKPIRAERLKQK